MSRSIQGTPAARPMSRPRAQPVQIWAALGAACLLLAAYSWISWILSPDFQPVVPEEPLPSKFYEGAIHYGEIASCFFMALCLWFWVIVPKWKTGHFSFMGLVCLASATTYWWDPTNNYYSFGLAYNAHVFNYGSWANFIPGFQYPTIGRWPEALLLVGPTFVWFNVAFPAMFSVIWKYADRKFPSAGFVKVFLCMLLTMFLWDMFLEVFWLRLQIYSYPGAPQAWSFFGGHYYQYPIPVGMATAYFFMGMTVLLHFRDDQGRSFAERGVDKLSMSTGKKTLLRFLALVGACWVIIAPFYFSMWFIWTHGDAAPSDMPSYMTNNLCGEKVGFPCPGKGVPIPRKDGDRVWVNMPDAK